MEQQPAIIRFLRDVFLMIDLWHKHHETISKTALNIAITTFTEFPLASNERLLRKLLVMRELMERYPEFAAAFRD